MGLLRDYSAVDTENLADGALMSERRTGYLKPHHLPGLSPLADRLEVSRQTVNALETGRYDPSLPVAFWIAPLFGQPIENIFDPDSTQEPLRNTLNG